ncbi:MAG: flavodoxin family protein [bacterium]
MGRTLCSRISAIFIFILLFTSMLHSQNILVTYYSQTGNTKAMAESVAKGARSIKGADVRLLTIDSTKTDDLLWADAIIVGSPVHNANVAAPVVEAMSRWPWPSKLKDKIGAAFVSGGGISAGQELTQLNLLHTFLLFNMIVVGGPTWEQAFGAAAITDEKPFTDEQRRGVAPSFLRKAEALGKRVAEVAKRINR